ncbi:TPA: hypothetical protein HA317_04795 [Candidatus Woesearchaeota archaeon]|nr:hypothetical protein [Candidatus Woesearchaeota archaeon]
MKNVEETLEDEGVPIEQGDKLIIQRLVQEERERFGAEYSKRQEGPAHYWAAKRFLEDYCGKEPEFTPKKP